MKYGFQPVCPRKLKNSSTMGKEGYYCHFVKKAVMPTMQGALLLDSSQPLKDAVRKMGESHSLIIE